MLPLAAWRGHIDFAELFKHPQNDRSNLGHPLVRIVVFRREPGEGHRRAALVADQALAPSNVQK